MMIIRNNAVSIAVAVVALALAGCASVQPSAYSGIDSSRQLQANTGSDKRHVPFKYQGQVDWTRYRAVIVEPAVVYDGPDAQFAKVSGRDRADLARYMSQTFTKALSQQYRLAARPAPDALRVKLTLTGVQTTTPFLGQAAHFDLGGNLYNGVQAVSGGKSAFGGSVSYAVEIYDSQNGQLLKAFVAQQYPNAMNLPAAFGSLGAARVGLDKGADALVKEMQ